MVVSAENRDREGEADLELEREKSGVREREKVMNEERECLTEMKLRPNKKGRGSQFFYKSLCSCSNFIL